MENKRILLIGAVDLVKNDIEATGPMMLAICNKLEPILQDIGFVDNAKFNTIHLIHRYGTQDTCSNPEYGRFNKRYSELPVSIEFDVNNLPPDPTLLEKVFFDATLKALEHISQKHDLPFDKLITNLK